MIIKEENIKQAYKDGCSNTKRILKTLFPECFEEDDKYFKLNKLAFDGQYPFTIFKEAKHAGFDDNDFMQIRYGGKYSNKAFYLSTSYHWELKEDNQGVLCLIPTRKGV